MKLLLVLTLVCLTTAVHDSTVNVDTFHGYTVYRTFPTTEAAASSLQKLRLDHPDYDFWTEVRINRPVDIMVAPHKTARMQRDLAFRGIEFEVMIPDVQKLIEAEKVRAFSSEEVLPAPQFRHDMTWTKYHSLEDMYTYLDYIEAEFDFVTTEEIGQSGEGRPMRVAKVCRGECGSKPAVWIDGGIHAREWISSATVMWMLKELVENDADHPDLLDNADWFLLPSHNPDGYDWSRNHNRMWRKTRSDNGGIFHCKGVDANRNWGFHWNEGGSSNDKCSDTYHGPEAFSEIENVNVRDFLLARKDKLVFFNNIHSYSQLILLPWGFQQETPDDYDTMYGLAMKGSSALTAVHGKNYETGCIPCMLYIASGSSVDWAHGNGVNFTVSMELRDTGLYGFLLPAEQIIPTAEEAWAFHMTVIRGLIG